MIILTGASASGKTEVGKALARNYNIKKVITYTTRPIRINEVNGIDYHFISKDEFEKKEREGFFFETMEYNGNSYGTSKESLNDEAYVILDFNGLKKYKASNFNFVSFYLGCSEEERFQRMLNRGDGEAKARERIRVDIEAFTKEIEDVVDFVIDTTSLSVALVAKEIFEKSHPIKK